LEKEKNRGKRTKAELDLAVKRKQTELQKKKEWVKTSDPSEKWPSVGEMESIGEPIPTGGNWGPKLKWV